LEPKDARARSRGQARSIRQNRTQDTKIWCSGLQDFCSRLGGKITLAIALDRAELRGIFKAWGPIVQFTGYGDPDKTEGSLWIFSKVAALGGSVRR